MINLISAGAKRDLKAARLNVVLLTYCVIVGCTVASVGLLGLFSHWWLDNSIAAAEAQKQENARGTQSYASVRQDAAAFSANLGKIQSVLTSRSHYSTALLNIAASLPAGASITTAAFSPTFTATPLQINATTPSNAAALALGDKLAKSPIYSKVKVDNVMCDDGSCRVSITATLNSTIFTPGATE